MVCMSTSRPDQDDPGKYHINLINIFTFNRSGDRDGSERDGPDRDGPERDGPHQSG